MRSIVLILLALLLCSCTVSLTDKGAMVREFSHTDPGKGCKFLGIASGSFGQGAEIADDKAGALNNLKNNIAKRGGNFFKIQSATSSGISTTITAEAFRCRSEMHSDNMVEKDESVEKELEFLKRARDKGLITDEQYKSKVNELLDIK